MSNVTVKSQLILLTPINSIENRCIMKSLYERERQKLCLDKRKFIIININHTLNRVKKKECIEKEIQIMANQQQLYFMSIFKINSL